MRMHRPARVVGRFAAAPLQGFHIVANRVRDSEGARSGIVAFLPSQLRAPPFAGGLLCLAIVEHRDAIGVLAIISYAQAELAIVPVLPEPATDPTATTRQPSIGEMEADFQAAEVGLRSDRKASARGPRFKFGVANEAGHC